MNRMVSFRLSDDEYREFMKMCENTNARSMSDVARLAVHEMLRNGECNADPPSSLEHRLNTLEQRLESLSSRIELLSPGVNGD